MTFAKPESKKDDDFDPVQRLMCSVQGCPNRWSVKADGDKPKCSNHQWQKIEKRPDAKSWHHVMDEF